MRCRFCNSELSYEFVDLGSSPPSNSFLGESQLNESEKQFPLKLFVCDNCFLVQIDEYKSSREIFNDSYAYFSSFSTTWLNHSKEYVDMITEKLGLDEKSRVVEIASNDGYLLQNFVKRNIPCLGVEPSGNTAEIAVKKGVETVISFFDETLAEELTEDRGKADLIVANNVLAHVPDLNGFIKALNILLDEEGTITIEVPHLLQLIENRQFDTIYHEHFSYFSFGTLMKIFNFHGLNLYDVEEMTTHGGSLRIYVSKKMTEGRSPTVEKLLEKEKEAGLNRIESYFGFKDRIEDIKRELVAFLMEKNRNGQRVAAYGAAAKGNTLLNFCGVKNDLVDYVVDRSPHKKGKYLPGSHIPVKDESFLVENRPDFVLILPWNIKDEIISQLNYIKDWGGRFVVPIPVLEVI